MTSIRMKVETQFMYFVRENVANSSGSEVGGIELGKELADFR